MTDKDTEVGAQPAPAAPPAESGGESPASQGGPKRRRSRGGRGRGRGGGGGNRTRPGANDGRAEDGEGATAGESVTAGESATAGSDGETKPEAKPARRAAKQAKLTPKDTSAGQPASDETPPSANRQRPKATGEAVDGAVTPAAAGGRSTATSGETGGETAETGGSPKRRRSRGGRGRGGRGTGGGAGGAASAAAGTRTSGNAGASGGGGQATSKTEDRGADDEAPVRDTPETQRDDATPDAPSNGEATPARRRRRRGGKGRGSGGGGGGAEPAATDANGTTGADTDTAEPDATAPKKRRSIEEQVAAGGPTRGIRTSRRGTGGRGRRSREPLPTPPRVTDKLMVITERDDRDQIAVLEEEVLVQHYVTRAGAVSMVGNVYLGRVQNVLPGMEAAFVDVGRGRNGVLYAGEVNYSPEDIEGNAPRIEQLLKAGQAVLVQVSKDPMGGKGARLTANLSLPGRYLVLAPNQDLQGISRRLGDEERKRLKALLKRVKPPEHGVIVRTAAEGASEEALETDLRRLLGIWADIEKQSKKAKAPAVVYEEPELTVRVVRDLFTDGEFRGLVTDSRRVYDKVMDYVREVAPDLGDKITLHDDELPAFEAHRLVEQIHKGLDRKVWLPSGGYLIIERTEAMTIIDVNTGKSVGKRNLEETVVNTNLEAASEAARQLRLRDIGGIIVIDFIDMLLEKNKKQVEDTMRDALAYDKTRSQVFEIGPLGLMQVTRKRVSSGLVESFSETCPTCEGRGFLITYDVD